LATERTPQKREHKTVATLHVPSIIREPSTSSSTALKGGGSSGGRVNIPPGEERLLSPSKPFKCK